MFFSKTDSRVLNLTEKKKIQKLFRGTERGSRQTGQGCPAKQSLRQQFNSLSRSSEEGCFQHRPDPVSAGTVAILGHLRPTHPGGAGDRLALTAPGGGSDSGSPGRPRGAVAQAAAGQAGKGPARSPRRGGRPPLPPPFAKGRCGPADPRPPGPVTIPAPAFLAGPPPSSVPPSAEPAFLTAPPRGPAFPAPRAVAEAQRGNLRWKPPPAPATYRTGPGHPEPPPPPPRAGSRRIPLPPGYVGPARR